MPQFFKLMVSVFTVIFSIGTTADSAGFECEKASTEIEKTICNDPYLSSLDEILNDLYFLKASINIKDLGFVHDDGTVLNFLEADTKSEQLEWINNDRAECFEAVY